MRIISERKIREFCTEKPEASGVMKELIKNVRKADWQHFSDVRQTFNSADVYGTCVIFDVGGNKYRIIAKIAYGIKVVFIRFIMTHIEYDKNKWRSDC